MQELVDSERLVVWRIKREMLFAFLLVRHYQYGQKMSMTVSWDTKESHASTAGVHSVRCLSRSEKHFKRTTHSIIPCACTLWKPGWILTIDKYCWKRHSLRFSSFDCLMVMTETFSTNHCKFLTVITSQFMFIFFHLSGFWQESGVYCTINNSSRLLKLCR